MRHPSVALAAVIGIPDEVRGEAIKAFVVAASPSEAAATELKALVRERLAAYEVPRAIEFVDELPLTTSGRAAATSCGGSRACRRNRSEEAQSTEKTFITSSP